MANGALRTDRMTLIVRLIVFGSFGGFGFQGGRGGVEALQDGGAHDGDLVYALANVSQAFSRFRGVLRDFAGANRLDIAESVEVDVASGR
jgi:predicted butyrate kinase (DUF1464 family)